MIGFTGQTYIVPTSARKNILFPGFLLVTAFYQKLREKKNIIKSSKAGEKISMFRCHQAVTRQSPGGISRGDCNRVPATCDSGLGRSCAA